MLRKTLIKKPWTHDIVNAAVLPNFDFVKMFTFGFTTQERIIACFDFFAAKFLSLFACRGIEKTFLIKVIVVRLSGPHKARKAFGIDRRSVKLDEV